ncbi:hypothetical protein KC323_g122 [Hortaea werneckii]|nr:hypothetical protein KC323_g122 [Hortaea werneckii]
MLASMYSRSSGPMFPAPGCDVSWVKLVAYRSFGKAHLHGQWNELEGTSTASMDNMKADGGRASVASHWSAYHVVMWFACSNSHIPRIPADVGQGYALR